MSQQQINQQNRQRVLAIELTAYSDRLEGMLTLPFGLALEKGVILQIDDGSISKSLRFRTCMPAGCLVPLNFDARLVAVLLKGGALKIKVIADGGSDVSLTVPLKGIGGAYSRIVALSR